MISPPTVDLLRTGPDRHFPVLRLTLFYSDAARYQLAIQLSGVLFKFPAATKAYAYAFPLWFAGLTF